MAKKKQTKFPAQIYVTLEESGTDDECLMVSHSIDAVACHGKITTIAKYGLLEVINVTAKSVIVSAWSGK